MGKLACFVIINHHLHLLLLLLFRSSLARALATALDSFVSKWRSEIFLKEAERSTSFFLRESLFTLPLAERDESEGTSLAVALAKWTRCCSMADLDWVMSQSRVALALSNPSKSCRLKNLRATSSDSLILRSRSPWAVCILLCQSVLILRCLPLPPAVKVIRFSLQAVHSP